MGMSGPHGIIRIHDIRDWAQRKAECLDVLRKDLSIIETARVGLSIAKQIENQEKRDHAISQLSLRLQNG